MAVMEDGRQDAAPPAHVARFAQAALAALALSGTAAWGQDAPPQDDPEAETAEESGTPTGASLDSSLDLSLEGAAAAPEEDFDGAGDELLLFEDIPVVISASRQARSMNALPVPVSVVTSSDIHYSGQTNLADVLPFFVPGLDSLTIDRNRRAVGVRGFHQNFSDRTLLLINGRNANSLAHGGIDLSNLPLLMEDIERVEVVRGPGGAAWGANAANGVINIITKSPEAARGVFLSSTLNEFGDTYSHVRWADASGPWSMRVSLGYEDVESSEDAIDGDNFTSSDWARRFRIDAEGRYRFSESSELIFGAAHLESDQGGFAFFGHPVLRESPFSATRLFARFQHEFEDGASGYIQWFTNIEDSDASVVSHEAVESDLELQYSFAPANRHEVTVGANVRHVHLEERRRNATDGRYARSPFDEWWGGVFVTDRWRATDRLSIEPQARLDHYSGTGADWSGRLSALYALDASHDQVLRFSAARSFRAPLPGTRNLEALGAPLPDPPGGHIFELLEAGSLDNEGIYALELGYRAQVADGLTFEANAFHNWHEDVIGVGVVGATPTPVLRLDNIGDARSWGAELNLAYESHEWRLSGWAAYNGFETDSAETDIRAFSPARFKAGVTGRVSLPWESTLSANYRWTNTTPVANELSGEPVGPSHRLDVTLAKSIFDGRGEVMIGVSDLFDDTDQAILGIGDTAAHETPGRSLFVRLQFTF